MIPYQQKHPIILPRCHLVTLNLQDLNPNNIHTGASRLLATARTTVWIIRGHGASNDTSYNGVTRGCTTCRRWKGKAFEEVMVHLPGPRVQGLFPSHSTGVDHAGPIKLKARNGRGETSYKGWIAPFVCMATKAIHLEAVTDLSTEGFIAALRRFVSRRGRPRHIYWDQGTNVVGATRESF